MTEIPSFLLEKSPAEEAGRQSGRIKVPFLEKGIHHISRVIKTAYVQWETATGRGLLQGLDARVKVLSMLFFVVIVSVKRDILSEAVLAGLFFAVAAASRLDLVSLYRRALFLGFFFGFLVAFPSSLNVITDGTVVMPLFHLERAHDFWIYHIPADIGFTRQGLTGVALLTLRVVNSVSLSLILLYTTPFPEIIRALKLLKAPDAFLMIISLTYKYIFIFAKTVEDMHLAKKSRMVGDTSDSEARKWIADRIAVVFKKTQLRCEDIFSAMQSRGFSGDVRIYGFRKLAVKDYMAGLVFLTAGLAAIWM